MTQIARKATNVSLDAGLLADARLLRINLSRAAEEGLRQAVAKARARDWLTENAGALESSNRFFEEHGLPLAQHRPF